jgi:hypothetical protein
MHGVTRKLVADSNGLRQWVTATALHKALDENSCVKILLTFTRGDP